MQIDKLNRRILKGKISETPLGASMRIPRSFLLPEKGNSAQNANLNMRFVGLKPTLEENHVLQPSLDKINVLNPVSTPQHLSIKRFLYQMKTENEKILEKTIQFLKPKKQRLNQTQKIANLAQISKRNPVKRKVRLKTLTASTKKNRSYSYSLATQSINHAPKRLRGLVGRRTIVPPLAEDIQKSVFNTSSIHKQESTENMPTRMCITLDTKDLKEYLGDFQEPDEESPVKRLLLPIYV